MAYLVEDGSGLVGSNSYNSTAEFNTYHVDRGRIASGEFTDAEVQAKQILARDYMDQRFGKQYRGWKQSSEQGCEWPRLSAYDNSEYLLTDVPELVKRAHHEYTLIALQLDRELNPIPGLNYAIIDPDTAEIVSTAAGRIRKKREKLGPIEEETEYSVSGGNSIQSKQPPTERFSVTVSNIPEYPQADLWIEQVIETGTSRVLYRG